MTLLFIHFSMQTQYRMLAKSHNTTNSHVAPWAWCWSHTEPIWARGEFSEAKAARPGSRTFTTSKTGDVPYSNSTRLAFELKTASAAPAAMKREGFSPRSRSPEPEPNVNRSLPRVSFATASCSAGECSAARADELSGHGSAMIQQGGGSRWEGTPPASCHTAGPGQNGRQNLLFLSWLHFPKCVTLPDRGEGGEGERRGEGGVFPSSGTWE